MASPALLVTIPCAVALPFGFYYYQLRQKHLSHPILKRALLHLEKDQRIVDFCGDEIQPGWLISKKEQHGDNWVKFDLAIKGASGKLNTTVIGDYLEHQELEILEKDRQRYFKEGKKDEEYIPTDFDAYSLVSQELLRRLN